MVGIGHCLWLAVGVDDICTSELVVHQVVIEFVTASWVLLGSEYAGVMESS